MGKIKVGYICDAFDMFSVKDLDRINAAKNECEKLIVGVYTDEYYMVKYGELPKISFEGRLAIVKAINGVDCAIGVDNEERLGAERAKALKNEWENNKEEKNVNPRRHKVGFIQGTFDMFHSGHLNLIMRAQQLCDELIVGVNTDKLVQEYKNKTPIVPYEDRIRIVSAIKGVHSTRKMEDRNKMQAARDIGFDALIMGDDWQGTEFYNIMQEELGRMGVEVEYLPYTQGISSTILRKKLGRDDQGNTIVQE